MEAINKAIFALNMPKNAQICSKNLLQNISGRIKLVKTL